MLDWQVLLTGATMFFTIYLIGAILLLMIAAMAAAISFVLALVLKIAGGIKRAVAGRFVRKAPEQGHTR